MGMQLELELGLDPLQKHEIDIELIQKQISDIRRSFFARMNAMEKIVEEVRLENEGLRNEIERLKTEMCVI